MADGSNNYLSGAGNAYGIYRGVNSGRPVGYANAAVNAGRLAGNLSGNYGLSQGAGTLGNALGIYSGIKQGGVRGYGSAAVNAAQLANVPYAGYLAAPLALYNFGSNWRSGATGSDALSGAETGAEIGSMFGPLGTLAGGVIGGAAGALSSAFGPGAKDPETYGVQSIIDATSQNKNNPAVAASVQDPYLGLAGLMDRRESTLPMYQQYGRMGEQQFANDLAKQINNSLSSGQVVLNPKGQDYYVDSNGQKQYFDPSEASDIEYQHVVAPWVSKMGSGWDNVGDAYKATAGGLLQNMTKQYLSGQAAQNWKAVGGDSPFSNIYAGSPLAGVAQQYTQQLSDQAAQQRARQAAINSARRDQGARFAAKGGSMKNDKLRSDLRHLYEGSFAERKRHFDDGGGVGYSNYYDSSGSWYDSTPNQNNMDVTQTFYNPTQSDVNDYLSSANQEGVDTINNPYGAGPSSSGDSGGGGVLGALGSALGVSNLGQFVQKYGALAPLLSSLLGSNKPASAPSTPAGYGAIPAIPTPNATRSYSQPNIQNWYTYGQGPEANFFSNNQLPYVPGVSPQSAAPSTSNAPMMTTQPLSNSGMQPMPILRKQGGSMFNSQQGDSYVPDTGQGDGTADNIDAKLSPGEYVMDAGTVSMLGNGSNEAGARALEGLRQRIRKHAGKHLVKGKQFMKAKAPEQYLKKTGSGD